MVLGSTPSAPSETETKKEAPDTIQSGQVDALLENVWSQAEEQVLSATFQHQKIVFPPCDDDGDVPDEPCPKRTLPEPCIRDQVERSWMGDIHEMSREPSLAPVTAKKKTQSCPPYGSNGAVVAAASLQNIARRGYLDRRVERARMESQLGEATSCWKAEDVPTSFSTPYPKQNAGGGNDQGEDAALVVHYHEGDDPMSDILRLEGGQGYPVIVEAIAANSKTSRAGVAPGDTLVSVNGRTEFKQLPGWQVRLLLEAPIALGFGPATQPQSKLGMCTEIRLKRAERSIGVSPKLDVLGPTHHSSLAEEVVFKPGSAPLFITGGKMSSGTTLDGQSPRQIERSPPIHVSARGDEGYVYELRQKDAQVVVGRAAHGARAIVEPMLDAQYVVETGARTQANSWRPVLPTSCCSSDFVAECVNTHNGIEENSRARPPIPNQFVSHDITARATRDEEPTMDLKQPVSVNAVQTSPRGLRSAQSAKRGARKDHKFAAEETRSRQSVTNIPELRSSDWARINVDEQASPRSSHHSDIECFCGPKEEESNWLDFHSPRSPLRWLAPVMGPVMRAFSPSRSPSRTMPPRSETSPCASPRTSPDGSAKTDMLAGMTSTIEEETEHAQGGVSRPLVLSAPVLEHAFVRKGPMFNAHMHSNPAGHHVSLPTYRGGRLTWAGHAKSAPRSRSPKNSVPAGDTDAIDDPFYYEKSKTMEASLRTPVSPPISLLAPSEPATAPSFTVSWSKDILNGGETDVAEA